MSTPDLKISEQLSKFLSEMFGISNEKLADPNASLSDDLGLDSIDTIDLLLRISTEFNLNLSPKDFENCETVGQFAEVIKLAYLEKDKISLV